MLGTAISPITAPIDCVREVNEGAAEWWSVPIAFVLSPLLGLMCGLDTDWQIIDPGWEWPLHHILQPIRYMPGH